jgi:hypothetical protein
LVTSRATIQVAERAFAGRHDWRVHFNLPSTAQNQRYALGHLGHIEPGSGSVIPNPFYGAGFFQWSDDPAEIIVYQPTVLKTNYATAQLV